MKTDKLIPFFESYLDKESVFIKKDVLQSSYSPDTILHRDSEVTQIANILAPSLRLEKPSNLFIYGKTGTGKTVTVKSVTNNIENVAKERDIPIQILYLNCKLHRIADTEYRLISQIIRELGVDVPATGLPTEEIYRIFYRLIDKEKRIYVLVLDEIDQLVNKIGDEIIYNLTRINAELKQSTVCFVGISNDLTFTNNLDPRVRSSLNEEEVIFSPYNATQIQHILKDRAKTAFKKDILKPGVIEKCSAYAAREHGDARRALDLLRVAGEISEREGTPLVEIKHIDMAEEKIERDRIFDIIKSQPKQQQLILYSFLLIQDKRKDAIYTGDIYDAYTTICKKAVMRPLTQRRVSDVIAEFDMLGILNAKIISKGRFGRTREIKIGVPSFLKAKIKTQLAQLLDL